jgi:hypothetical protein
MEAGLTCKAYNPDRTTCGAQAEYHNSAQSYVCHIHNKIIPAVKVVVSGEQIVDEQQRDG